MLIYLSQKGKCPRLGFSEYPNEDRKGTGLKMAPNPFRLLMRNVVSPYPRLAIGRQVVRQADESAGMGNGKKRMPNCNGADRGSNFAPTRKGADFPTGLE